ncbi:MAG: TolC family protein [Bacillota bacterium]
MIKKLMVFSLVILSSMFFLVTAVQSEELSLKESIEIARENDLELKILDYDKKIASSEIDKAEAGLKPDVSLNHSYTRQKEQETPDSSEMEALLQALAEEQGLEGDVEFDLTEYMPAELYSPEIFSTELGVEYPLYTGGRLKTGVEIAQKSRDINEIEYRKKEISLGREVTEAYFQVLKAQNLRDLNNDFLQQADEFLELTKDQKEAGVVTDSDVLQAESEKAGIKRKLKQAESRLEIAKRNFRHVLGLPLQFEVELQEIESELQEPSINQAEAYKMAEENNPDLELMVENREIKGHNISMAQAEEKPQVFISGNYSWQGEDWGFDNGRWSITGGLSYNIFDGGRTKAEIKSAETEYEKAETRQQEVKDSIELGIDQVLLQLEEIYDSISYMETQKKAAQDNLELTTTRYEGGLVTALEVTSAQTELRQIETELIQQKYDYYIQKAQLGELLGYEDPRSFF